MTSYVALWILVGVLAVAVVALYRHFGQMYLGTRDGRSIQGPREGEQMSMVAAMTTRGDELLIPVPARPTIVVFAETTCTVCSHRRSDFARFVDDTTHERVELLVVCGGPTPEAVERWATEVPNVRVVADVGMKLAIDYGVGITPFTVAVDASGIVRSKGLLNDYEALLLYAHAAVAGYEQPAVAAA